MQVAVNNLHFCYIQFNVFLSKSVLLFKFHHVIMKIKGTKSEYSFPLNPFVFLKIMFCY